MGLYEFLIAIMFAFIYVTMGLAISHSEFVDQRNALIAFLLWPFFVLYWCSILVLCLFGVLIKRFI